MKFTKIAISSLWICAAAAGCTHPDQVEKTTLIVAIENPPTTLDPRYATDAYSQRIDDLIFSSLIQTGPQLKPVAQAASEWRTEKKKIIFKIRKDLKFQSGRPVTLSDVVYSIDLFRKSGPSAHDFVAIKNVEIEGDDVIVLNLLYDDAPLLSNLTYIKIVPRESIERLGNRFAQHPDGSGPYQLDQLDDSQLTLKRAAQQSYARPQMEKIIFKFIRDDNTRFLKMIKGDIDIIPNAIPEEKIKELRKSPNVTIVISPGINFNYLLLNLKDPVLKNPHFRHALFASLDRNEIINFKLDSLATPASSMLAPVNPFSAPDLSVPAVSLERGRALIRELKLAGREFSFKVPSQATAHGTILAQQMERLGIRVKLQTFEWGTFYSDVKKGRYQLALMRWVGVFDPDLYRDTLSSTEYPPGRNRGYYSNKAFDALVEQGRREFDFAKRKAIYLKVQQIILDDMPIIPLWYNANIHVLNRRVKNFSPQITGGFQSFIDVTKE